MLAFAVRSFGELPAVIELPDPTADDAFLIRVTFAGVNPIDYKLVEWRKPTDKFPFVVGIDVAGVLERVPEGVHGLRVGDRVFGTARTYGSYAAYTKVLPGRKQEPLARIPDGVTDEQAAALPVAGLAALGSLNLLGLKPGQKLVVMGAAGSVGGYATQIARSRGVNVIATVRGNPQEALKLGASHAYDASTTDVVRAIGLDHPGGVDAVLDLINTEEAIRANVRMLKPSGMIVSTLQAADKTWFGARGKKAHNLTVATNEACSIEGLSILADFVLKGILKPRVRHVWLLNQATALFAQLGMNQLGSKALIRIE